MDDQSHMRAALSLARRGLGHCWPNPSVGCVVVKEGRVVGRAVTAPGGRPHAEPLALAMAGAAAEGATVYVTLEPCCHHGRTPPCTDALIAAGVARVVVATRDCDPRVDGEGIARLREAGIAVDVGLLAEEAQDVNAGFFTRIRHHRPLVTLKLASTLDGRIATHGGESRWVTGGAARRVAHALRGHADAIMAGVGTVLTDDPDLTCRIAGYRATPLVRVVADSHLRTRLTARLVATARETPTWILARPDADAERRRALTEAGVSVLDVPAAGHGAGLGVDLAEALQKLAQRGITRLLVEGGAQLAAALLRADLVDRVAWFHAPAIMGADGWPAAQAFGVADLAAMPRFVRTATRPVGEDVLTELRRAA
ncbi:MAG TPA: bifunctional diaminohydroxyphosphoribosylaminopyrimidine deaminase/5-amino-6-(5-phosphoribosylamino)uracil reductase RibD [Acetobacteraceae bacterium]|nr:bifunctional diaminohydroxyphosphoribosylaminopyrimidine deaminase/5-amino-6-(5-phosphoribosylamino)uracil reductase RibD [Acetobacteraceae bacterium]